jgi:alpha-tubulin suppressor-like RCC1 family protein
LTPVIAVPTLVPVTRSDNGQITTWGDNPPYNVNLIPQDGNNNIAQIAMGAHHALAVTTTGNVIGWGTNLYGELTIPNMSDIVQVAVGLNHSVALKRDGSVQMWGKQTSLTAPSGGRTTSITQIAAGDNHTVLLGNDGRVFVYGSSSQPGQVIAGKNIVAIAAGSDSSLALGDDGAVYRWGVSSTIPVRVAGSVMRIFATGNLYGALRSDGELILWGSAVTNLVLTDNASSVSSVTGFPCIKIPSMVGLRSVNLTKSGVILTRRSQQFLAFAYQGYTIPEGIPSNSMQLSTHPSHGFGMALAPIASQVIIPTNTPATSLTLRLPQEFNTPGYLRLWGSDPLVSAIPVTATSQLLNVATGDNHIAVLGTDGIVTSWGDNRYGQSTVPAALQIARPLTDTLRVVSLAAGADHTMALRANGSVMAWGNNDAGQVTIPTGFSNVVQLAAGVQHSVALLADGTVRSWGGNSVGQTTQPALGGIEKLIAFCEAL